jgi:hypothetical protein
MHSFWLTPIDSLAPFVLGADRIYCKPIEQLELFREELKHIHPRLLMLFKAGLLPGDPNPSAKSATEADRCGVERVPFTLAASEAIRFDGETLVLSSCAQAMIHRLIPPEEAYAFLVSVDHKAAGPLRIWYAGMEQWLRQGKHVILIREEEQS